MMKNGRRLRILLADDHEPVRRGLRSILEPRWEVCAEAGDGAEAVERARIARPDVVLLDLKMPGLNGIEAAREILEDRPGTRVLLMTVQPSPELSAEARRAGIDAVIPKSDAELLGALLGRMERTAHLAGATVGTRHIGAFFASDDERYRVLTPFIAEGLARGEKAIHIVGNDAHAAHLQRLSDAGIDIEAATQRQRFEATRWDDMYLVGGSFDQHAMVERVCGVLTTNAEAGFRTTRLVATMEWALEEKDGVQNLAEYESRLNYVLPSFGDVIVCTYDLSQFSAAVIIDVIRAHPAVLIGGTLADNPFYTPPEVLIHELGARP